MRGIIFRAYNRCNTKAAVLFTAIIFTFLHMRLNELVGLLFMGIVASLILIKSNSLYAAMVYHAFSNLTALLFSAYIAPGISGFIYIVLVLAIVVLVVVLRHESHLLSCVRCVFCAGDEGSMREMQKKLRKNLQKSIDMADFC